MVGKRLMGNPAKIGRQKAKSKSPKQTGGHKQADKNTFAKAGKLLLVWHDRQSAKEVYEEMGNR